ncbi:MAG: LysM peptidoglycan-binding domain-containing protein, partial [Caldilineaceae bacterium]|nr:LysM peptidoglycan-binding domain-containing protein [Caldilineaceae bacterium]
EMMPMPKGEPMQPEKDAPMAKPEGKPEMGPPRDEEESPMMQGPDDNGTSPWRMARQTPQVHTVRAGETLSQIAAQYGLDPSELARLNGISNANFIYIGQEILLPTMSQT